ncbi:MAG: polysaccharide pyruvyl transferase family protein [Thermomicrobiales bacterium]
MEQTRYRIGISGSYGGMNLGDEAILREVIHELRRRLPVEITVFSLNPDDTLRRHDVERAVPVRDLSRAEVADELRSLDLFILGGGGILFDPDVRQFLREAQIAKDLGVPVMTWAIGVGPLVSRESRRLVLDVLNRVDLITVRESSARLVLEDIGVMPEIHVTADPALLMEPEPVAADAIVAEGFAGAHRVVGLSIREPGPAAPDLDAGHYHSLLANTSDYLVERLDATVAFVPLERRIDLQHAHAVVSRMANPERAHVLKGAYTSGQMLSLISRFDFAIGMRLHFLIFAALARVPFVPLPYASKVGGFVRALDIPALPIQQMNAGQLLAFVDRSWDRRRELKANIDERLPPLIDRGRHTGDLAVDLLLAARPQSVPAV